MKLTKSAIDTVTDPDVAAAVHLTQSDLMEIETVAELAGRAQ